MKFIQTIKHLNKVSTSLIFLLCILSFTSNANDFIEGVAKQGDKYEALSSSESSLQMALTGKHNELNSMLVNLVPDAKKTAGDYFILSNMLYANNHDLSFYLMKKAYDLKPTEVAIIYEMGIHNHRGGNHTQAIEFYQKSMASDFISDGHNGFALLADCYLRTGQYSKAVDAWLNSNPKYNRIKIEKAIHSIYAEQSPHTKRSDLFASIQTGKHYLLGNLIELDHSWKTDWWNPLVNEDYLEYDLEYAAIVLGDESTEYKEILLLNDILSKTVNTTQFLKRLEQLGIWGETKRLPKIPALTYYFIKKLTDLEMVGTDLILKAYESELIKKKIDGRIDDFEFKILSFLYSVEDLGDLEVLDLYAWKNRDSQVGAESYFYTQFSKKQVSIQELQLALSDFPNSVSLNFMNLELNTEEERESDIYAAIVAAEYPNLERELSSSKLRAFFRSLAKQIKHKSYTDTLDQ